MLPYEIDSEARNHWVSKLIVRIQVSNEKMGNIFSSIYLIILPELKTVVARLGFNTCDGKCPDTDQSSEAIF